MIQIPELALIMLIGPSGSGKSTFAAKHFKQSEIISSDYCRFLISDEESNQNVSKDAFELLYFIAAKRLARGKLVVIDATNIQIKSRANLSALARRYHVGTVGLVFNLPCQNCLERNKKRQERQVEESVIVNQYHEMKKSFSHLAKEGFSHIYFLNSEAEIESAQFERYPLPSNKKHDRGPFDIIGDIHGCFDELYALVLKLGYQVVFDGKFHLFHPQKRKLVFVGDLVDRGPKTPEVLRFVMDVVKQGMAYCVNGNHDNKLLRKLKGHEVKISHGLAESLAQLDDEPSAFKEKVVNFLENLPSYYLFDGGKLAVAHAAIKEKYLERTSTTIRKYCMYGPTTGEVDESGLPVRKNWAENYAGEAYIVYGHTPHHSPKWINKTLNIDTGCVFGGNLTALRYPEFELVSVKAKRRYFLHSALSFEE